MRLPIQLQGLVFHRTDEQIEFLFLKRNEKRGGFWQGITGGLEEGETKKEGVLRELNEETGIKKIKKITETDLMYQFMNDSNQWLTEYVFIIELAEKINPEISDEHTEYKWASVEEGIKLFKWEDNKDSLKKVHTLITKEKR